MGSLSQRLSGLSPLKLALAAQQLIPKLELLKAEPIAIIGIGCRFPGGGNCPEEFWNLLKKGRSAITDTPPQRWEIESYYDPNPETPGKMYTRQAGYLSQVDRFDAEFFGISPREALLLDPQHRLLLEVAWEALENAAINPEQLLGSPTGVFLGICTSDYFNLITRAGNSQHLEAYVGTGNALSAAAGRLSYTLGLKGISVSVNTACSSSLLAVHLACQSLRQRECNQALVGGVNLLLAPDISIIGSKARMLSPSDRCKTFDSTADGYVRGEGCGLVVLKRLSDALRDQDPILAVIRGSASNQDGRTSGFTVPNGPSQQAVIREALENGGVTPDQVSYVETHGTGTPLGDPIEVGALAAVFSQGRSQQTPLVIGSVKTNIGHLEGAAGITGLIKVVLALQHQSIPPSLNFHQPNPQIDWENIAIQVATSLNPWLGINQRHIAGVSSFGFTGTNVHVILEAAPPSEPPSQHTPPQHHLLTLSAKNATALQELTQAYLNYLQTHENTPLRDICHTTHLGRAHFEHRLSLVADSSSQLVEQLNALQHSTETAPVFQGVLTDKNLPKIAFLFTGQGSQYSGMGQQLYQTEPVFRQALEQCDQILRSQFNLPLIDLLYSHPQKLQETANTQPALFALEYALYQLWKSWGIQPDAVIGHSLGEYVAACIAGVFSLEDGLKLIAHRGRLMQQMAANGKMIAVWADEHTIKAVIAPDEEVTIAAFNGRQNVVISGKTEQVDRVALILSQQGYKTHPLNVSLAFHSPLMQPMVEQFRLMISTLKINPPQFNMVANLTGNWATSELTDINYWVQHVLQPVQWSRGLETLVEAGYKIFLEIGSKPTLINLGKADWGNDNRVWLASLHPGKSNRQQLLESLASLYVQGLPINWQKFAGTGNSRRSDLPNYPWQKQSYWLPENTTKTPEFSPPQAGINPLLGERLALAKFPGIYFQTELSCQNLPFLADHRVYEQMILPGTAYLEMALAAGSKVFGEEKFKVKDFLIREALFFSPSEKQTVQMVLTRETPEKYTLEILGLQKNQDWVLKASGLLEKTVEFQVEEQLNLEWIQPQHEIEIEPYYKSLKIRGVELGETLQTLEKVWEGEEKILAKVRLPKCLENQDEYKFHPVLLDGCLQGVGMALVRQGNSETYLPIGLDALQVLNWGQPSWSLVTLQSPLTEKLIKADLQLFSVEGKFLVKIEGMQFKQTHPKAFLSQQTQPWKNWLYQVNWKPKVRFSQPQLKGILSDVSLKEIKEKLIEDFQFNPEMNGSLEAYQTAIYYLDRLALNYILIAWKKLVFFWEIGAEIEIENLLNNLEIHQRYWGLTRRYLEILTSAGFLEKHKRGWKIIKNPEKADYILTTFSSFESVENEKYLLEQCGSQLAEILQGKINPLDLLFPQGDITKVSQLYQQSPLAIAMNSTVKNAINFALKKIPKSQGIKILEIGAGTGGTTASILPILDPQQTEYTMTDLGSSFLQKAAETLKAYSFIQYQVLDIEKEPISQGFQPKNYDIIIAANVLHATRHLPTTLGHVKQLLAPDGILILLEVTQKQNWIDLTFGLTEGWWKFQQEDVDLRPDYPLLSPEKWAKVLKEIGWTSIETFEAKTAQGKSLSQQQLFLAQNPRETLKQKQPRTWLIFADRLGWGEALAELNSPENEDFILVFPGETYQQISSKQFEINPASGEEFEQLLTQLTPNQSHLYGIIHCWSLQTANTADLTTETLKQAVKLGCESTLHLVQALNKIKQKTSPRLWLITRQAVGCSPGEPTSKEFAIAQSPLWGFGKTLALEHPELECIRIDITGNNIQQEVQDLWAEIQNNSGEDQIALHNGWRQVPRLVQKAGSNSIESLNTQPLRLEIDPPGSLENLQLHPQVRQSPQAGEVEIQVQAASLNFRDLMISLGLYPEKASLLGLECAGTVVAVGEGVSKLKVGDRAIAMTPGSFSQFVTVNAKRVVPIGDRFSLEAAATIPSAFLTAHYTLNHLAQIKANDRILIHAASGGVGLAAIQIAQIAASEIFATAHPDKWEVLRGLGVKQIMNSRSLNFADEVMELTNGEGVDIVLNSLTSEGFIAKNLSILKPNGRYLEIAKRNIWQPEAVAQIRPDVAYFPIDLMALVQQQPDTAQQMLQTLISQFEQGTLKPLPHQVFPFTEAVKGFRLMQQAKHTGKIVFSQTSAPPSASELRFRRDATYVITGGLGGLGLMVADWMAEKGAKHLVLVSRTPTAQPDQALQQLENKGVQVRIVQADVSVYSEIEQVFREIEQSLPPLKGVIHSAGVLNDGLIASLSSQQLREVLAPKVEGAWHLHQLTQDLPLDFFVLFSAAASLLGNLGQSNHSAANAFLDALVYQRHAQGLPACCINWGAVSQVGAAAKRQVTTQLVGTGISTIPPQAVLEILEAVLTEEILQVGVIPIDWSAFGKPWRDLPFFDEFQPQMSSTSARKEVTRSLAQQLQTISPEEAYTLLFNHVNLEVAQVLGLNSSASINPQQGFFDLGMDSLTSVELRNKLQKSLNCDLPPTLLFKCSNIEDLVDYLGKTLGLETHATEIKTVPKSETSLENLSESEVAELLAQELKAIEESKQ